MQKSILVLEESPAIQGMIASTLPDGLLRVHQELDPNKFVQQARQVHPDLILLSNSDRLRNYRTCRTLRHDDSLQRVPLVLLLNGRDSIDEATLRELGISGHLRKPFEVGLLHEQIRQHLSESLAQALISAVPPSQTALLDSTRIFDSELLELIQHDPPEISETPDVDFSSEITEDASKKSQPERSLLRAAAVTLESFFGQEPAPDRRPPSLDSPALKDVMNAKTHTSGSSGFVEDDDVLLALDENAFDLELELDDDLILESESETPPAAELPDDLPDPFDEPLDEPLGESFEAEPFEAPPVEAEPSPLLNSEMEDRIAQEHMDFDDEFADEFELEPMDSLEPLEAPEPAPEPASAPLNGHSSAMHSSGGLVDIDLESEPMEATPDPWSGGTVPNQERRQVTDIRLDEDDALSIEDGFELRESAPSELAHGDSILLTDTEDGISSGLDDLPEDEFALSESGLDDLPEDEFALEEPGFDDLPEDEFALSESGLDDLPEDEFALSESGFDDLPEDEFALEESGLDDLPEDEFALSESLDDFPEEEPAEPRYDTSGGDWETEELSALDDPGALESAPPVVASAGTSVTAGAPQPTAVEDARDYELVAIALSTVEDNVFDNTLLAAGGVELPSDGNHPSPEELMEISSMEEIEAGLHESIGDYEQEMLEEMEPAHLRGMEEEEFPLDESDLQELENLDRGMSALAEDIEPEEEEDFDDLSESWDQARDGIREFMIKSLDGYLDEEEFEKLDQRPDSWDEPADEELLEEGEELLEEEALRMEAEPLETFDSWEEAEQAFLEHDRYGDDDGLETPPDFASVPVETFDSWEEAEQAFLEHDRYGDSSAPEPVEVAPPEEMAPPEEEVKLEPAAEEPNPSFSDAITMSRGQIEKLVEDMIARSVEKAIAKVIPEFVDQVVKNINHRD